jgi:hypothetical protein
MKNKAANKALRQYLRVICVFGSLHAKIRSLIDVVRSHRSTAQRSMISELKVITKSCPALSWPAGTKIQGCQVALPWRDPFARRTRQNRSAPRVQRRAGNWLRVHSSG